MFSSTRTSGICLILFLLMTSFVSIAQPTLPDMIGSNENGLVLLSWTCQYDGVKSISVLRSVDSNFNYSTIGYVKKLYKGVQGYIDGHPIPGKNFYKLSIVFNSGLTWTCNHYGVYVDSETIKKHRVLQSNDALQKLIVTDNSEQKESPKTKKASAPADRDKYMEVFKKDTTPATVVKPKIKLNNGTNEELNINDYMDALPETKRPKISVTYDDDLNNLSNDINGEPAKKQTQEQPKKISITFDDKADVNSFIEALPKSNNRKITISFNSDANDVNPGSNLETLPNKQTPAETKKKISLTFKDEEEVHAYMESLPKSAKNKITISYSVDSNELKTMKYVDLKPQPVVPSKPKISIKFSDELNTNSSAEIKSKYISVDAITGHVNMKLPNDVTTHNYSIKFFDKENHAVVEVPKINAANIIFDKRNFQKKGQYKFTIRKNALELESGLITIY